MKKRKTFSKVLSEKILISIPILISVIVITFIALNQYSKSKLTEIMEFANRPYVSKILESEKAQNFYEEYNFLKFRTNLKLETTLAQFPGIKGYIYITDSDGNTVMDTSPAWGYIQPVRDDNMDVIERKVYVCDYQTLCRFDEVREVLNSYNTVFDSTFLEFVTPNRKDYQYIEILEGFVNPETLKVYPTKVQITTERIPSWMGGYEDTGDVIIDVKNISMPLSNTEGLITYMYDTETNEIYLDGEKAGGIHILTGRPYTLDDYQAVARRPFSHHMTGEQYYTDPSGNEYVIFTKLTDDFLKTYLSFIILLSVIYFLIDLLVCFLLANLSYSNLRVFYQNEDYRKALMHSMAHDLKTPLTVMSGYAENLKENVQAEKREHYAEAIIENTQYMNALILDILSLSKIEETSGQKTDEKPDFCEIAKDVSTRYEDAISEKNIKIDIHGSFKRKANKAGIERVMDNLIGNAVKYTKDNGSIKIYAKDTPFSSHSFIIENTPFETINVKPSSLWNPFVKGDESRSGKNGTGLGLSIVRNILQTAGFKAKIKIKGDLFQIIIK